MLSSLFGAVVALVFCADVFLPDPVPYLDELVLFLFSVALNMRARASFFLIITLIFGCIEFFLKLP